MNLTSLISKDYRELLKHEFQNCINKNPQYSLRAFARDLKISPTTLSLVFQGKRALGENCIDQICSALLFDPQQSRIFRAMVLSIDAKTPGVRLRYTKELDLLTQNDKNDIQYFDLSVNTFRVISDWFHLAILELLELDEYSAVKTAQALQWMSDRLALDKLQVTQALERLHSLKLIEKKKGKFVKSPRMLHVGDKVPSEAIRNHHKQYLTKAERALNEQSFNECDFSGIIVPVDVSKIPEAKEMIQSFRKKMNKFLRGEKKTEVYRLSINFFKLTNQKGGANA